MRGQDIYPLVFVVDDDPTIVHTLVGLLARAGFRTGSAVNMAAALREIRAERPDLVLLDVNLPDGCGFEICRTLRSEPCAFNTPILFISASEAVETKLEGFEAGGVDYITKPIIGPEVIARVRTHLRLRQAHQRLAELQVERMQQLADAQKNLMPLSEDFPEAHFSVAVRQVLSAGGDFYDVYPAGEGIVDYLVADASGHDLGASLWTASLKALANEYAGPLNLPAEIVHSINGSLCRILPSGAFFTLLYARLNHRTGRLTLVNAGHPPAIIVRGDRQEAEAVRQEGDVLGAFADAVFGVAEVEMRPGDRLFLSTDGLIEIAGSYEVGLENLSTLCSAQRGLALSDAVAAVANSVMACSSLADDTLLMGIER